MQIIVNHLTRMQPGFFCAAGIDPATNRHVRPMLRERLKVELLAINGGPFSLAALIDLGQVKYCGEPPEVEDYYFNLQNVQRVDVFRYEEFWKRLQLVARRNIVEIFGPAIKPFRRTCVVDIRTGNASLGCLIPAVPPRLFLDSYGRLWAAVADEHLDLELSVTDIRLCEADHKTPKEGVIQRINKRIQDDGPVVLSVGLPRAFRPTDDSVAQHWLQVNNIHLKV
jgi:hypothetical protein